MADGRGAVIAAGIGGVIVSAVAFGLFFRGAAVDERREGADEPVARTSEPAAMGAGRGEVASAMPGSGASPAGEAEASRRRSEGVESEVALLKEQVKTLRDALEAVTEELEIVRLDDRGQAPGAPPDVGGETAIDLAARQEQKEEEVRQQIERDRLALRAGFEKEEVDPQWAEPTEGLLRQAFSDLDAVPGMDGVSAYGLECRATLCRFEMDLSDSGQLEDLQLLLSEKTSDRLPSYSVQQEEGPDGRVHATFYLAAEGANLPLPGVGANGE